MPDMFSTDDLGKDFEDVVKVNGVPIILCRWGVKKVSINGHIFLTAMSQEEEKSAIDWRNTFPRTASRIDNLTTSHPHCVTASGWCHPQGGCKKCEMENLGNAWRCKCVDS